MPGCFFCFDGLDGTGKSTQTDLFLAWLNERPCDVVTCHDPGSTPLGESLRAMLLDRDDLPIGMTSEMLMYMAARAQLVEDVIRPALDAGKVVVSDRFLLANVVYQGHAGGLSPDDIWSVGDVTCGGLRPDCTFLLDLDAAAARSRVSGPGDRLERRDAAYWQRVRDGYLREAQRQPGIVVINAAASIETVQQQIREAAAPWIEQNG